MTKRFWFRLIFWMWVAAYLLGFVLAVPSRLFVYAQAAATATLTPAGTQPYITVNVVGEPSVNIRTGPNTADYPVIGHLPIGATAPALGVSPNSTWIQISFPSGPDGVGWVYAANVQLVGSPPFVEPPPTATPLATQTIDPTLAAAFSVQPTTTRLPTFTPSAPLVVPTFSSTLAQDTGFPLGVVIVGSALLGLFVLLISFFGRR